MTLLIQVAGILTIITGSTFSKALDVPNNLQIILASSKVSKEAADTKLLSQIIGESAGAQSMLPEMENLLQLRRSTYNAYNFTYEVKDQVGHTLYRNEYGDGSGSLNGYINFVGGNGKKAVFKYSYQLEDQTSSSEPEPEPRLRSSVDKNEMAEESSIQKEEAQIISASKATQTLKSTTMDDKGTVLQQEKYFYHPIVVSDFDGQTLSSQIVNDKVNGQAFDEDLKGSVVVLHMKPIARGYEKVWKKGEGLSVDKQYELPNYEFRNIAVPQQNTILEADEDAKPVSVYQTSPIVRVFEMSRDTDGNYQVPKKYNIDIKQQMMDDKMYRDNYQGMEDDEGEVPLYITHSKPSAHFMVLNSDEGGSPVFGDPTKAKYSSEFPETESRDSGYRSFYV